MITKNVLSKKKIFGWKNWQKRDFWSKKSQKIDEMELSWPIEIADSLRNQKKLAWNDSDKYFEPKKKNWSKMSKIIFFESKNDVFEQKIQ